MVHRLDCEFISAFSNGNNIRKSDFEFFSLGFFLRCEEARFCSSSVFMAVSDDPHIIKTCLSLAELHFVIYIIYYLVYVLA